MATPDPVAPFDSARIAVPEAPLLVAMKVVPVALVAERAPVTDPPESLR